MNNNFNPNLINDLHLIYIKSLLKFYSEEDKKNLLINIDELDINECHDLIDFILDKINISDKNFYKQLLYKFYYKNKCSLCRPKIFDSLFTNNLLDKEICEIAMYDVNKELCNKASEVYNLF